MRSHLAHLVNRGVRAVSHTAIPGKLLFLILFNAVPAAAAPGSPTELLHEGLVLMETGACAGALELFDEVISQAPRTDESAHALFLSGQCLEGQDDLTGALERYDRAIVERRRSEVAVDARFRRGLVLAALDQPAKALRDYRRLGRIRATTTPLEDAKLDLQMASCHFALGRPGRATDKLLPALEVLTDAANQTEVREPHPDPEVTWYLAQAHVLAGDLLAEEMGGVSLAVESEDVQTERFERKMELFERARQHYRWSGHLGAPLWVCASGYRLGCLYERLREGLLEAPAPTFLSPVQVVAYGRQLRESSDRFLEQALVIYRDMLTFAAAAGVRNKWVELAEQRLAGGLPEPLPEPLLD